MAEIADHKQWGAFAEGIWTGQIFAFVDLERPGLSWLRPLLAQTRAVFSLLGEGVELGGLRLPARSLPQLHLCGVQPAKDLFAVDETVPILSFYLGAGGSQQELLLRWNGQEFGRYPLQLDAQGLAVTGLRSLPAGSFVAELAGRSASFEVAQYRLSPLTVTLLEQSYAPELEELRLHLYLEHFGKPYSGLVEMALDPSGRELAAAAAVSGMLRVELSLQAEPKGLHLWLSEDAGMTASLALPAAQAQDRRPLVVSRWGPEVSISTLPQPGDRSVRGLSLHTGGECDSPFRLERVDTGRAVLTCARDCQALRVLLLENGGCRETELAVCRAGQVLELDVHGPAAVLALGAFVEGVPWEGWTALLRPAPPPPRVVAAATALPGGEFTLGLEGAEAEGSVYLCVSDLRHTQKAPMATVLAGCLKSYLEEVGEVLGDGAAPGPPQLRTVDPFAAAAADPFGYAPSDPFTAPPALDPFSAPAQDPFGYPDPFAAPTADPFGGQASDPFAAPAADPFGAATDPFAAPAGDPFGYASSDPFAAPAADPFNAPAADPFGYAPSDPFAAPPASDPFAAAAERLQAPEALPARKPAFERQTRTANLEAAEEPPTMGRRRSDRSDSPLPTSDVVFCGILPLERGKASLTVRLPQRPAEYRLSGMLVQGWDWVPFEARLTSFPDPLVWLEGPAFLAAGQQGEARMVVASRSGHLEVGASSAGVQVLSQTPILALRPTQLRFPVEAGELQAWARDTVSGQRTFRSEQVQTLGSMRRLTYSLQLLQTGESLPCWPASRVIRDPGETFRQLLLSWLNNLAGNCLSEAVGVVAAACLLPLDPAQGEGFLREKLEKIRRLWLPGQGFRGHGQAPAGADLAVPSARLLRSLGWLPSMHPSLQPFIQQGLAIAQDVEYSLGRPWPPPQPDSCEDAYFSLRNQREVAPWLEGWLLREPGSASEVAYAAACCLRLGWHQALPLCQQVLHRLDPDPGLSHPLELAATAMVFAELQALPDLRNGKAEVEGETTLTALQGIVAVQASVWLEEDWLNQPNTLELELSLSHSQAPPGQTIFLEMRLQEGSQPGDMVWVFLPECLCRLEGGGQVRLFSLEWPAGHELRIPLLSLRSEHQPLWVGLRNFLQPARRATRAL